MVKYKVITLASLLLFCNLFLSFAFAQNASFKGIVVSADQKAVPYASISLKNSNLIGVSADNLGKFELKGLKAGRYLLSVSAIGYRTLQDSIQLAPNQQINRNITLKPDVFNLSQVVITGSRSQVERYNSPVIVNSLDSKTLESTQSFNLAEGLNYTPGLRVENNCQNCGFTQVRMNGLDGAYSQVLINSRPVFSALAGVYGLEMIPTNMVDRIEVVRGGGSVMFGGNAIAGTVNIITKEPVENSFEAGINQALINGEASDRTVNFNGALVAKDLNKGISFFGFNRDREHWDANNDGFSEIVALQNNTFGFDAFYKLNPQNELKLGTYFIDEFRRGGNKFELFPHQTDLTEQLQHNILNTTFSFDHNSKDNRHKLSVYGSLQRVDRASYYGGGGRVLSQGDSLTEADLLAINAYGNSKDFASVSGLQYRYELKENLSLTTGTEYIYNAVKDEMPGYGRLIEQEVGTWGTFTEIEFKPTNRLTVLAGGRLDQVAIDGTYNLVDQTFKNEEELLILVPRLSAMYQLQENLKVRASFAQGYRGPQAFDEDLHIETVGGAARFIQLQPGLEVERSNSSTLSLNYDQFRNNKQFNFVLEGFYTELMNPFVFANQTELPNGVAVINKRNGTGATVSGVNLEANIAIGSTVVFQSGATFQQAIFQEEEELWAPEPGSNEFESTSTKRLLRTPDTYAYFSLLYSPTELITIAYSAIYTGSMDVAHVIDAETERTVVKRTPDFFENNLKLSYSFKADESYHIEAFGGVQNIFDSYQNDFDLGAERDAGYVYGPLRPRTYFMGLKLKFN